MSKQKRTWLEYTLWAALAGFLFFTDAGKSTLVSLQQLILKTGLKNAPTESEEAVSNNSVADGYPHQFSVRTLDGKSVELSELRGKVVFLNQWATWCPPCRAEMPAIQKLYESVDQSKIAFVMLSLDDSDQKARDFVQEKAFTFPVYLPAGPLPAAFASEAIPTTIILDPNGQIRQRIEGIANYDTDGFRQYLLNLSGSGT
ncbi:TlpA family protein disulfide reductase [Persicitalea jodogahamensis]|uniref:Thioredoxin n=1 Tax=Persicitalea jodogahamensis TaxID=402147 RepID=A0A8J3D8A9_9BACT|nr:TlpA disulfide reductase family protein [Persicitalea jodogahamensis]GHB67335.1 thioredoxin [Persicitalea jodogahamensis]